MTRDGYRSAQAAYDAAEPEDGERVECPECGGSGGVRCDDEDGAYEAECRRCGGTGERRSTVASATRRGPEVRAILAAQAGRITHWKVIEGDYTKAPERFATWFIDPPYLGSAGRLYKHGAKDIDYAALSRWCL